MATTDTKPARPGRPRSAESETAILESAYDLLAAEGLAAASIEAIAKLSGVSKMTIYKWWPTREQLLVDAFLRRAARMLPLSEEGDPLAILQAHAGAYASALATSFGKVQLAVISECVTQQGDARYFARHYLGPRRDIAIRVIERGQRESRFAAASPARDLYDRIYGTLFYQYTFGWRRLSAAYARALVAEVLVAK
ncbi:TetR/AcrR family transcriptional regulator [Bordetella sp. 2513F-2]